uniref:HTH_48 domain-containing protein n=1 Tax=Heterorhabditis bacteriophora TaxID=37862 RepID=A0A1I7WPJ6_HETBA
MDDLDMARQPSVMTLEEQLRHVQMRECDMKGVTDNKDCDKLKRDDKRSDPNKRPERFIRSERPVRTERVTAMSSESTDKIRKPKDRPEREIYRPGMKSRKTVEKKEESNQAFGEVTVDQCTAQHWFRRFRNGDECLEDEEGGGRPLAIDDSQLRVIVEAELCKTTREVAEELDVDHSTAVQYLHQIERSKKLDKWMPHELKEYQKKSPLRNMLCASLAQQKRQIS